MNSNFCHRHYIEIFGSHSSYGIWVVRILETKSYTEYLQVRERINSEITAFLNLKIQLCGKITKDCQEKIDLLIIMLTDPNFSEVDISEIQNSVYFIEKWANWIRKEHHIPRCSNNCEDAHRNINRTLKGKKKTLKKGFKKIVDYVLNYLENRQDNYGYSFQRRLDTFINDVYFF